MLRPALFAVAVLALVAPTQAADPDLSGNWILSYSARSGFDQNIAIIQVEMKDGKPEASVLAVPGKGAAPRPVRITIDGKTIKLTLASGGSFEGTVSSSGKDAVGNYGDDRPHSAPI